MARKIVAVVIVLIFSARCSSAENHIFPSRFSFGAASAAYQIEGAWNVSGRGESIWDRFIHSDPSRILLNENADIACDSYHRYLEDIKAASTLGLNHYRFSISWSRLLPTGFNDKVSFLAIAYYQSIIKELKQRNIKPMVTLYHWDLPQSIQDLGGWTNPRIVDFFRDYAEVVFTNFPDVPYWITINEPNSVCVQGYGYGKKAPGLTESGISDYRCAYNVAKAHATVYRLYQHKFKKLGGKISMALNGIWTIPAKDTDADKDAALRKRLFEFGLYANPMVFGSWPKEVEERIANIDNSSNSRLPSFTEDDKHLLQNGSYDFLALNYYTTIKIADGGKPHKDHYSYDNDLTIAVINETSWKHDLHLNNYVPTGLRSLLKWIKDDYKNPEIIITENGIADNGDLNDTNRKGALKDYLTQVWYAINEDKVKVTGYTFWSLIDNFEWTYGYEHHFGLYQVNFTDPNRTRTEKESAKYYQQIIHDRGFISSSSSRINIVSPLVLMLTLLYLYI